MEQVVEIGASKALPTPDFDLQGLAFDKQMLNNCLRYCLDNKAEDLVLMAGVPWSIIWSGRVVVLGKEPLSKNSLDLLVNDLVGNPSASIQILNMAEPYDFAYTLMVARGQSVRFRVSVTGVLGVDGFDGLHIVMRPTSGVPPTLAQLNTPQIVVDNCMPQSGIVLVCGPTGSGKTTFLNAIAREILTGVEGKHVLTYYSPIEDDLNKIPNKTGIVAQSEVGGVGNKAHIKTYAEAVRNALRRHPHVVIIGEARDMETIDGAIALSMTGHATYTTVHTSSVEMAIPRMADFFGDERARATNALIDNVRLIYHQRLVETPSGIGRAPVRSFLVLGQDLRNELLRMKRLEDLPSLLHEAMRDKRIGLSLYDDAVVQYEAGKISERALLAIENEWKESK